MTYCTLADLQVEVGTANTLLCFDDDNDGIEDTSAVESLLTHVDVTINAHVSRLYSVAGLVADPPDLLRTIAVGLALARMGQRRPNFNDTQGRGLYHARGKESLDMLADIRDGKLRLDVNGSPEAPKNVRTGGVYVATSSSETTAPTTSDGFFRNGGGFF